MTDRRRAQVYAAEAMAFEGTDIEEVTSIEMLIALAERLIAEPWWMAPPVEIGLARSDARSSSTRWIRDGSVRIRLASPQCTPATLVHELAHALAGSAAAHGPVFRRAHVDVATRAFGVVRGQWLQDAYLSIHLELGERHWPCPPREDQVIAL